ncbi:hypothetical protein [Streptomyces sp. NPDC058486]|uniref:hypothetical protein n=1 Tax=unclassified Streptomyces TaxID=2593676 RepID=UPI0036474A4A
MIRARFLMAAVVISAVMAAVFAAPAVADEAPATGATSTTQFPTPPQGNSQDDPTDVTWGH